MNRDEIFQDVLAIIVDQIGLDASDISMNSSLRDDLDVDSLDLLQIVTAIEDGFDITIEDEIFGQVETVGDAVEYIENLIS